jgi:hypothetical protein
MTPAEKLFCARCITFLGALLVVVLALLIADTVSDLWLTDLERELASSLEVVSNSLVSN